MKAFNSFVSLAAVLAFASITHAAPGHPGHPGAPASTVSCKAKYHGVLHYNDLDVKVNQGVVLTQAGKNSLVFADTDKAKPVQFHFDDCVLHGWNTNDGREFGQVKADSLGDYKCLTAGADTPHKLTFESCSAKGDKRLARQWFSATHVADDGTTPEHVTLRLRGNPNKGTKYDLPRVQSVDANDNNPFAVFPASENYPDTLNLFDVTTL